MLKQKGRRLFSHCPLPSATDQPIFVIINFFGGSIFFMILKFGAINGFSTGKDGGNVCVTVSIPDVSETAFNFCHVAVEVFLA